VRPTELGVAAGATGDPCAAELFFGRRAVDRLGPDDIELPRAGQVVAERLRRAAHPAVHHREEQRPRRIAIAIVGEEGQAGWLDVGVEPVRVALGSDFSDGVLNRLELCRV